MRLSRSCLYDLHTGGRGGGGGGEGGIGGELGVGEGGQGRGRRARGRKGGGEKETEHAILVGGREGYKGLL